MSTEHEDDVPGTPEAEDAPERTAQLPPVPESEAVSAPSSADYSHLPPPTPPTPEPTPTPEPASPYVAPPPPAEPPAYAPFELADPYAAPTEPVDPAAPKKQGRGGVIALLAAVAVVAGALGGWGGSYLEKHNTSDGSSTTVSATVDPKALNRSPTSIAGIAAKALPSVVTIQATGTSESGTGSGFVFNDQGYILTNNHVVAPSLNGGKLTVKLYDGSSYSASIVGRASGYDIAVVKLDNVPAGKLKPLPLGNSDEVAVGDTDIAIGAPFGLSETVTSGIISAKNRPVASGDSSSGQSSYMNALQTDAAINPGNSGGPSINAAGQVIGINSAIQSTSSGSTDPFGTTTQSGSIGLGFAIPINEAKRVAAQLISTGKPVYPVIGVLRDDNYTGDGAEIATAAVNGTAPVTAGGPADEAGLKPGDVITQLDNIPIDSGPTLVSEIWSHTPGQTITITYTRSGQTHTTTLTLGSRVGDQ